jgi:Zn finger protein HypA/HybF involved in hydrogenase expression
MSNSLIIRLFIGVSIMFFMAGTCMAASIETLMMPGKVIQGHAKYEEQCNKCHERFDKSKQTRLCLDCHKKVASDVNKKQGYHGRIRNIETTECKYCHTDHKGRGFDIVQLDVETFNHDNTDFRLDGAHDTVRCEACHKKDLKYREADTKCIGCHKDDDIHKGRLGKSCEQCHGGEVWTKSKYDHNKTKFPLKGKHKKTSCNTCHPNEQYKNITKECLGCHRLDDVHGGRYGKKCQDCHTPKEWKHIIFNHDKDTKFKLKDRHIKVACDSCHKIGDIYKNERDKKCIDCHKDDDEHKTRYGKKCESCHSEKDWKESKFNHDKTDFLLRGKHKEVECDICHKGDVYKEDLGVGCITCHQHDDVHKGQEGKQCERCHNDQDWGKKVIFDHDLTRFPLNGLHAIAPCEECHIDAEYKGVSLECVACHKSEDEHKQKLGPNCELCHNPNSWLFSDFDHDKRTDYKLEGKHKKLDCLSCHRKAVKKKIELSSTCGSCHRQDDEHNGSFGRQCDRCHNTKSFKEIELVR